MASATYKNSSVCPVCLKECKEGTECILCDSCSRWHHRACANLSPALFRGLVGSNDQWGCKACSEKRLEDLVKLVERQGLELKQLVDKVEELEAEKTGLTQLLHERMDGLPDECVQATSRLRNLLFIGLEEQYELDPCTRRVRERAKVTEVLKVLVGQGLKVRRFHRVGKWKGEGQPRPLLMEFLSLHDRDRVLAQAFRLKRSDFRGVFVRPDTGVNLGQTRPDTGVNLGQTRPDTGLNLGPLPQPTVVLQQLTPEMVSAWSEENNPRVMRRELDEPVKPLSVDNADRAQSTGKNGMHPPGPVGVGGKRQHRVGRQPTRTQPSRSAKRVDLSASNLLMQRAPSTSAKRSAKNWTGPTCSGSPRPGVMSTPVRGS